MKSKKIVLPGGAGLVGQNLIAQLKSRGYENIIVIDKHKKNLSILHELHPTIVTEYADLAEPGNWEQHFKDADVVVMLQAQIGHLQPEPFIRNNITATELILSAIKKYQVPHTVHISSSVVESVADDLYTNTKKQQERIVLDSGINVVVLRPTLMFGWFDRKHLGWLSRFMKKVPIFPIPGHGRYMRQPLYVGDFCNVIISCIDKSISGKVYNISGLEKIDYYQMIYNIKQVTNAHCVLLKIPYLCFYMLLKVWSFFDKNPPFTTEQLKALTAGDSFEVIDWPRIFDVSVTPFVKAIDETFNHVVYSKIELNF